MRLSYEEAIRNGGHVDKSDIINSLSNGLNLLLRPGGFGKTYLCESLVARYAPEAKVLYISFGGDRIYDHELILLDEIEEKLIGLGVDIKDEMRYERRMRYQRDPHKESMRSAVEFASKFKSLIEESQSPVVVLIDGYDAPLLSVLKCKGKKEMALSVSYWNILRPLYETLEESKGLIKFALITGSLKLDSLTQAIPSLNDISQDPGMAAICGLTMAELCSHYERELAIMAYELDKGKDRIAEAMSSLYGLYKFSPESHVTVMNFRMVTSTLRHHLFDPDWFERSLPRCTIKVLKESGSDLLELSCSGVAAAKVATIDLTKDKYGLSFLYYLGILTQQEGALVFPNQYLRDYFTNRYISLVYNLPY